MKVPLKMIVLPEEILMFPPALQRKGSLGVPLPVIPGAVVHVKEKEEANATGPMFVVPIRSIVTSFPWPRRVPLVNPLKNQPVPV